MQRPPESTRPKSAKKGAKKTSDIRFRMVLEEIGMSPPGLIENVGPLESVPAFGATLSADSAKIVRAKGAEDLVVDFVPIDD